MKVINWICAIFYIGLFFGLFFGYQPSLITVGLTLLLSALLFIDKATD